MSYKHINNLYKNQEILMVKECYAMEKIHGTSAHITYKADKNELNFFSGGCNHARFLTLFDADKLKERFGATIPGTCTIYGEAYGGKLQGMSATYGKELGFVAFEVEIGDRWLNVEKAHGFVESFGQVGAVITSSNNEVISTGANDVPCPEGGLYWSDDPNDKRDFKLGYDSNEKKRNEIAINIMGKLFKNVKSREKLLKLAKQYLKGTGIFSITEYGRAVHAEMEALMACARSGVSPRGGTLYCTTFPCHNCAKHIVAAGIKKVVFIEPYPKSKAFELHQDSIFLANEGNVSGENGKVKFMPFVGVGPRRFIDLFSMNLNSGKIVERKLEGNKVDWERKSSSIRVPLSPISYIERETYIMAEIDKLLGGNNEDNKKYGSRK